MQHPSLSKATACRYRELHGAFSGSAWTDGFATCPLWVLEPYTSSRRSGRPVTGRSKAEQMPGGL